MPGWRGQPHSTVWETGCLLQFLGTVQTLSPQEWKEGVSSAETSGLAEVAENWGQMKPQWEKAKRTSVEKRGCHDRVRDDAMVAEDAAVD